MSVITFGVHYGMLPLEEQEKRDRAADKFGIVHIYSFPPEGVRSWFQAQGKGEPFDSQLRRDVMSCIEKEEDE